MARSAGICFWRCIVFNSTRIFVLQVTGSTTIMGSIMALVTIPRIILGTFAGVIVDRCDRKKLIILGDLIRG